MIYYLLLCTICFIIILSRMIFPLAELQKEDLWPIVFVVAVLSLIPILNILESIAALVLMYDRVDTEAAKLKNDKDIQP